MKLKMIVRANQMALKPTVNYLKVPFETLTLNKIPKKTTAKHMFPLNLLATWILAQMSVGLAVASASRHGRVQQQQFATQPSPQTAILGSTVVLPCRVLRMAGELQWTRDDFGLGNERELTAFKRYKMIGSHEEGASCND